MAALAADGTQLHSTAYAASLVPQRSSVPLEPLAQDTIARERLQKRALPIRISAHWLDVPPLEGAEVLGDVHVAPSDQLAYQRAGCYQVNAQEAE